MYYYGLIAVMLFSVIGALYIGLASQMLRGFGNPNGGGNSYFDGREMLTNSFLAFPLIALTLAILYSAVHFFKDESYFVAFFFLVLSFIPAWPIITDGPGHKASFDRISAFLIKKNPFKPTYEKNDKALKTAFDNALNDKKSIQSFIRISSEIARNSPYAKRLKFQFANYSTKLLLNRLTAKDYDSAEKIINNYIDNILPFAGYHRKSEDVASNALFLSAANNNEKIAQKVMNKLLGPDFDINSTNNEILLFNLAGYYATRKQKEMMLQSIERALTQGKKADQFLSDSDFKYYLEDKDFIALLQKE